MTGTDEGWLEQWPKCDNNKDEERSSCLNNVNKSRNGSPNPNRILLSERERIKREGGRENKEGGRENKEGEGG